MGGRELLVAKAGSLNLREESAKATLRDIRRSNGHDYVELRKVGKRTIYFCVLCQSKCFNETVLKDHLNGNFHTRRRAAAEVTLLGPLRWPFSDGVLFFSNPLNEAHNFRSNSNGEEVTSNFRGISDTDSSNGHGDSFQNVAIGCGKNSSGCNKVSKCNQDDGYMVIRDVLINGKVSKWRAKLIGYGHIGSKILDADEGGIKTSKIWCAWLGRGESEGCKDLLSSPNCDFAVISFSYTYDLGRKGTLDDLAGSFFEVDESGKPRKKRKKSFSDPEDSFEGLMNRHCSSAECSDLSGGAVDASHELRNSRFVLSKAVRRELRKDTHVAAERRCDICGRPMLLGKDVATLFNCKTGKLACSSRNINGAFHLFHVSCLVHWILLCEFEMWTNQSTNAKPTTRGRKAKSTQKNVICSVFCPECQGTGKHIEEEEFEKPTVPISEMFLHKVKAIEAQKAWMKNPEDLQKCSTGLHFLSNSEKLQEKAMPMKLLHFYRADE